MSIMDWIFTGIIILLAARCFVRGFVQEVLSVASYGVGLLSGLLFSNALIDVAAKKLGIQGIPASVEYVVAFIVCFVLGFLLMKIVEKLIREGLEAANLDIFDRVLGLVLGIAEGLLVVSLALVIMDLQPFFNAQALLAESLYAGLILPIVSPAINDTLRPSLSVPGLAPGTKSGGTGGTGAGTGAGTARTLNLQDLFKKK